MFSQTRWEEKEKMKDIVYITLESTAVTILFLMLVGVLVEAFLREKDK